MQQYNIHLPLGTLALIYCEEYPTFISAQDKKIPTLVIFPSVRADLELCAPGADMPPYLDSIAALSYHFAVTRALPGRALDVIWPYGRLEIPLNVSHGLIKVPLAPCRRVFTESHELLGVSERISTVMEHTTTRIIENIERCPSELLSRLRVIEGMPTADRALSYKLTDNGYSILTTDSRITTDSLSPLVRLLSVRGVRGEINILSKAGNMRFEITDEGREYALYSNITHTQINS